MSIQGIWEDTSTREVYRFLANGDRYNVMNARTDHSLQLDVFIDQWPHARAVVVGPADRVFGSRLDVTFSPPDRFIASALDGTERREFRRLSNRPLQALEEIRIGAEA